MIVVVSTAIGRLFAKRMADRLSFFREYQLSYMQLTDRVVGINLELYKALISCQEGTLKALFESCAAALKKTPQAAFQNIWQLCFTRLKSDFGGLSKDDVQIVLEGGGAIEALCMNPSEKQAGLYLKRLSGYTAVLETEKNKKCKLYNTTGVLAGLMIALLVI
jgi:stage III sporulation protein AB